MHVFPRLALASPRSKVAHHYKQEIEMSDLIDSPEPGMNAPEFTVTELSGAVKRMVEGEFGHVRVRGEVGRVSRPASGHIYLDLKDDRAVIAGVIWRGVSARLRTPPEQGMEVVATGKLTTFPGQSKYQIVIEDIAPAGVGALMAMLEKRRKAMAAEGLFDTDRKKPIPYLPRRIGVVTSPSGAVIRDILHRLRDRFPSDVIIWPVAVQGEKCPTEVSKAITGFNAMTGADRPDLLIVARGGGSVEDLWGFNEEAVVRAVVASDIPVISAIGHETDTTLIDYAADIRAPTPTAAAELAVPVRTDLLATLGSLDERRSRAISVTLTGKQQRLRDLSRALPRPLDLVLNQTKRLDGLAMRLPSALTSLVQRRRLNLVERAVPLNPRLLAQMLRQKSTEHRATSTRFVSTTVRQVERFRDRLEGLERLRQTLGYRETLRRGYAVIRDDDRVLTTTQGVASARGTLTAEFFDGRANLAASDAEKPLNPVAKPKKPPKPASDQGDLF
jgi:exodeoxyribonuclease VII large subunit